MFSIVMLENRHRNFSSGYLREVVLSHYSQGLGVD